MKYKSVKQLYLVECFVGLKLTQLAKTYTIGPYHFRALIEIQQIENCLENALSVDQPRSYNTFGFRNNDWLVEKVH